MNMTGPAAKKELRLQAKTIRAVAAMRDPIRAGKEASNHALKFFKHIPKNQSFALYAPINHELDCRFLAHKLDHLGYILSLPVVTGPDEPLLFRRWGPEDPLETSVYDIPVPNSEAPMIDPDIIICPCLGFDEDGYRLGYGGGFYDRTLGLKPSVRAFGYAFSEQIMDHLPREKTDIPMQAIITPDGLFIPKLKKDRS